MIFRAIFWIGLVAILMPHEPDLGYGRPGANLHLTGAARSAAEIQRVCASGHTACAGGLALFNSFQAVATHSLEQVRADLAAHRRPFNYGI
jgi:hypothetical protein